jgi:hypothetical protein
MRMTNPVMALSLAALIAGAACRGKAESPATDNAPPPVTAPANAPLSVASIDLGKSLNPDKTIGDRTTAFAPADTIYVSVATTGASSGSTLAARFTYGSDGQLVKEESRQIAPGGAATTEFHVAKPDGWPVGQYQVAISLNGTPAGSKSFEVSK